MRMSQANLSFSNAWAVGMLSPRLPKDGPWECFDQVFGSHLGEPELVQPPRLRPTPGAAAGCG
jgi:hypothetical protein